MTYRLVAEVVAMLVGCKLDIHHIVVVAAAVAGIHHTVDFVGIHRIVDTRLYCCTVGNHPCCCIVGNHLYCCNFVGNRFGQRCTHHIVVVVDKLEIAGIHLLVQTIGLGWDCSNFAVAVAAVVVVAVVVAAAVVDRFHQAMRSGSLDSIYLDCTDPTL